MAISLRINQNKSSSLKSLIRDDISSSKNAESGLNLLHWQSSEELPILKKCSSKLYFKHNFLGESVLKNLIVCYKYDRFVYKQMFVFGIIF